MIVSQFELVNYAGPPTKTTRYVLYLTSLADSEYRFRLTLRTFAFDSLDEHWYISWNSAGGSAWVPIERIGPTAYVSKYWTSPRPYETVRIQLLPTDYTVHSTARGYLELSIPPYSEVGAFAPQGDEPVPVILQAMAVTGDHRAAIPISSGKALNEIMPEQTVQIGLLFPSAETGGQTIDALSELKEQDYAAFIGDPGAASSVVAYLAAAGQAPGRLKTLNDLLERGGHRVRVREGR